MSKRMKTVYLPVMLVVIAVLTLGVIWYIDYSRYETTDDAYVEYNTVSSSSKIMGRIMDLKVHEGDLVKKGDLLFDLDSADLVAQLAQAKSQIAAAEAKAAEAKANAGVTSEDLKVLNVNLSKAQEDYDRANVQFSGGVITREKFDHATKELQVAKAKLETGKKQLVLASAREKSAEAAVETSKRQVDVLKTKLDETHVYAPANGTIAKRWMLPGDVVQNGQSVFSVVETGQCWIKVYIEETKMEKVRVGSRCLFTIDTYPGVTFKGKVFFIGKSTESQFSLIPPNNAAGNFTKVTQRIPLKISIDGIQEGDGKITDYPLYSGMSSVVKIFKR